MARQRISEHRAKSILFTQLGLAYNGVAVDGEKDILPQLKQLDPSLKYVVKVDQGVKKRMKRGLISLNKDLSEIPRVIEEIKGKGYLSFLIEPMASYDSTYEKYLAIDRGRQGYQVYYSKHGGIEVEEHEDEVKHILIPYDLVHHLHGSEDNSSSHNIIFKAIQEDIELAPPLLEQILEVFDKFYFSFLEINPLIIHDNIMHIIDLAVEVDSVAEFFVNGAWTSNDFTYGENRLRTPEEIVVEELKSKSQAAFTLDVLNPNGSIFMLLSGGGASLVLADEVANEGKGKELANYGEYSGNPNEEETYLYTKQVLSLLLHSSAPKKVLIIGGGVANFTDVRITFRGVIKALAEMKSELKAEDVKVFVRRGGPNQQEGLALMKTFLEKENLYGTVVGPDVMLTDIVHEAVKALS